MSINLPTEDPGPAQPQRTDAPPLVAISILNWNGWRATLKCLESVRHLDYPNYLTIVVDNGSWDGSVEKIEAWAEESLGFGHVLAEYGHDTALAGGSPPFEQALDPCPAPLRMVLIRNEKNLGFTGGNNVAIHYALRRTPSADYVFLLNNDVTLESTCLKALLSASLRANAGIVGATTTIGGDSSVSEAKTFSYVRWLFDPLVSPEPRKREENEEFVKANVVIGIAMLIRRDVLESLRMAPAEFLDDRLFFGWDETDLCHRAGRAGYNIVLARHAVTHDLGHKTVVGGWDSPLYVYYRERNKILVAKKVLPLGLRLLFHLTNPPLAVARAAKNLIKGRPKAARAAICGLVDGYRGIGGRWKYHDREAVLPGEVAPTGRVS